MKRLALVLALLGVGLVISPAVSSLSAAAAGPGPTRIGVIDIERTLYETPAGKRASNQFDRTRKAKQAQLDKEQQQLQKYAAELDKQASVLKPDVLKQKRADLQKRFVNLQQLYTKLERDLASERADLIQKLLKQAQPIIRQIAKEQNVDVIVDQSAVLWADSRIDLTAQLNARMK